VATADPRRRSGWAVIRPATGRSPGPVCLTSESPGLARLEPIPQTVARGASRSAAGRWHLGRLRRDTRCPARRWIRIVTRPGMKRDSQHGEQSHGSREVQRSASHPIRP
jgi:hypothetical protein